VPATKKILCPLAFEEKPQVVLGFHGSRGNRTFAPEKFKGVWFAVDRNSDIIEYYSARDEQKTLIAAHLVLGRNLDLSMYNTDEKANEEYVESFLRDMGLSDSEVTHYIDYFFYEDQLGDYDDDGNVCFSFSAILNHLIEFDFLPENRCDSVTIREGDEHITHCVLRLENIKIVSCESSNQRQLVSCESSNQRQPVPCC